MNALYSSQRYLLQAENFAKDNVIVPFDTHSVELFNTIDYISTDKLLSIMFQCIIVLKRVA